MAEIWYRRRRSSSGSSVAAMKAAKAFSLLGASDAICAEGGRGGVASFILWAEGREAEHAPLPRLARPRNLPH